MNPALVGAGMAAGKGVINGDPMDKIIKDAVVGGATGYLGGQMMPTDVFGASTALNSTANNSLNAGAGLMGGTGTAVGSNIGAGTTSLLGSKTGNMLPAFDMGMGGNSASLNGFMAAPEASQIVNNSYMPLTNSANEITGPNMSAQQTFLDTPSSASQNNFGNVQPTDNTLGMAMQEKYGYADGNPLKTNAELGPRFDTPVKSTAEELEAAQGGFEKPLYERAFDSVMGFAEKNPIEMAGLGLTAFGATKSSPKTKPDSSFARSAGVVKQAYSPTVSQMKIRRA